MSERKIEDIEQMFKKTAASKPKLVIDSIPKVTKIGAIYDNTLQGTHALLIASILTKKLGTSLNVIASQDFSEAFNLLIEATQEDILDLVVRAKQFVDEKEIETEQF